MFRGRSTHALDDKGRIIIPARFRDVLKAQYDDRLVITNLRLCLVAYPFEEWRSIEDKAASLSDIDEHVKAFLRLIISGAIECPVDRQGRVLVPPSLREYARLEKEIVLVGMLKHFEIWDKSLWDEEMQRSRDNYTQISAYMAQTGL
ncbi:MAG: division/cell wall cluster transcriptional repressor MraZ [Pseudomonadota bacterium]